MEQWKCKINGETVLLSGSPTERLRDVLFRTGYHSVRDSDDSEGFAFGVIAIDIGKGIAIDGPRVGDGVIRLIDLIADKLD